MINLVKYLKKRVEEETTYLCDIEPEWVEPYPDVRFEPLGEDWRVDNLGNKRSKIVDFKVHFYTNKSHYATNVEFGVEFIEYVQKLLKDYLIVEVQRCKIVPDEIPGQLLVKVTGNCTVKIYKRR